MSKQTTTAIPPTAEANVNWTTLSIAATETQEEETKQEAEAVVSFLDFVLGEPK